MRFSNTKLGDAALAGLLALAATAPTLAAPSFETVDFGQNPEPRTLTQGGLDLLLYPLDQEMGRIKVVAVVRAEGMRPFLLETDTFNPFHPQTVGIGTLSAADTHPSVILQTYTGGAHCCTVITVITPVAGRMQAVNLGEFNAGGLPACPQDLDGDGMVDFMLNDDRFLYEFAPYYASWAPPRFLNILKGQVVDVSAQPGFRPHFQAFSAKAKAACANRKEPNRNGACAAYVASEARLGRFATALQAVKKLVNRAEDTFLPTGCGSDAATPCPDAQKIRFYTFEAALRWFLKRTGYID